MVNKRFGEGTVLMGDDPSLEIVRLPTGILSIDLLTHGGFPRNRHVEIYGTANIGKTYLTYRLLAETQRNNGRGAFFDVEKTYDPKFAKRAGVDTKALEYVPQRMHGNKLIDVMEAHLRSGFYDVIVLDSIASLLPKGEMEKDMEAGSYGTEQAKMMSAALRRLTAANKNTALVYINQTRDSIGSIFGPRQITSGGRAMGFYAGMRIEIVRTEAVKRKGTIIDPSSGEEKDKEVTTGHRCLVRIEKNKTGGALIASQSTFVFDYRTANIDPIEDLLYCGRYLGWVHKKGDFWWLDDYESDKKRGRNNFKRWLKGNPAIAEELADYIRNVEFEEEDDEEEA